MPGKLKLGGSLRRNGASALALGGSSTMAPPSGDDSFSALGGLGGRSVLRHFFQEVYVSVGDFLTPVPNVEDLSICKSLDNVP